MNKNESNTWITKKSRYVAKSKLQYCSNCGKHGHVYKECPHKITSYGVINMLITTDDNSVVQKVSDKLSVNTNHEGVDEVGRLSVGAEGIRYSGPNDIRTFCTYKNNIRFMMVRRRHTLGFMEFIRGRYSVDNIDGIISLFSQMTSEEMVCISKSSLDELWTICWSSSENKSCFQYEYEESKRKYNRLRSSTTEDVKNLDYYVKNVKPRWKNAEWGFPKGRRNSYESDIMCGLREFHEESGVNDGEYVVLDRIKPLCEDMVGTNNVCYRHIYYPALSTTNKLPVITATNLSQSSEIGEIGWFTYDEAMNLIRPHHTERKRLLTELYMYIINTVTDVV